ncbi:MAG: stress response translation initiation inhibitor YciH [Chloroflexi bacterium]|nr:stress response translation initiation inhibitor YciH [Chloroflexota bacterium]
MSDDSRIVYSTDGTSRTVQRPPEPPPPSGRNQKSRGASKFSAPADGTVRIFRDKSGRRGKIVSVVIGIPEEQRDEVAGKLKRLCGSGGTVTDTGAVEIQGDHRERIDKVLTELGFRTKLAGG